MNSQESEKKPNCENNNNVSMNEETGFENCKQVAKSGRKPTSRDKSHETEPFNKTKNTNVSRISVFIIVSKLTCYYYCLLK